MKCHYDVLGLRMDADDEQIKKAYRKKALKWHPDKNRDNAEVATEQFRLVQAAYDVLIDPQERAWYDRHRDEILHKSEFSSFKDGTSDILQYFTPSAYKGFGNDTHSFYSVYEDVFRRIYEEDKRFCSEESEEDFVLPDFGAADSDYDEIVHPFYASWQAYSTKLSYVWVEKYDKHEAPERRVARLIEKENKKERDKEKKKRNEIVRDLVRFVRKRDPRVQAHKEELEVRAAQQAEKTARRRVELLKARVEEAAVYEEQNQEQRQAHEEKITELEDQLRDEFGFSSENSDQESKSESDDDEEQLYCPACNKQFKTSKAFTNHERSKKHKEKMTLLQAEMKEELDQELNPDDSGDKASDSDVIIERPAKLNKRQKKKRRQKQKIFGEFESDENEDVPPDPLPDLNSAETKTNESANEFFSFTESNPRKKKKMRQKQKTFGEFESDENEDAPQDPLPDSNSAETTTNESVNDAVTIEDLPETVEKPASIAKTKRGKRAKKNAQQNTKSIPDSADADPPNLCVTCQSEFPTRNKLFQHLKSTGHAMLLNVSNSKIKKNKRR